MYLCSIVPHSWLGRVPLFNPIHLLLAQEVLRNERYREFYAGRAKNTEDYIILDNGAFENEDVNLEQMWEAFMQLGFAEKPNQFEIVIPEVKGSVSESIALYKDFIRSTIKKYKSLPKHMVVLQGASVHDAETMYKSLLLTWAQFKIDTRSVTLGIPKYFGDKRRQLVEQLVLSYGSRLGAIHLLGYAHIEDRKISRRARLYVRSMDTSYPAVKALDRCAEPKEVAPSRPADYFNLTPPTDDQCVNYYQSARYLADLVRLRITNAEIQQQYK